MRGMGSLAPDRRQAAAGGQGDSSMVERLLADFHAGLIGGHMAGLVVDRYRRPIGDPPALVTSDDPPSPAHAAAVKKLLTRAKHWGPRLCRLVPEPMTACDLDADGVTVTALIGGPRRYVLVFNPSLEHYGRGEVRLPASIGGAPAARAVGVPASATVAAGGVFNVRQGRITIPVMLRPGDAALYEIF